jgi:glucose-fructose oxidoreductase
MDGMEETIVFTLEFPGDIAATLCSSYAARNDYIEVSAEQGNYGLNPSYGYAPAQGFIRNEKMDFPHYNQQAVQMDAFAKNILEGTPVIADGEMGVQDMRIIEAIYKSAKKGGKRVRV